MKNLKFLEIIFAYNGFYKPCNIFFGEVIFIKDGVAFVDLPIIFGKYIKDGVAFVIGSLFSYLNKIVQNFCGEIKKNISQNDVTNIFFFTITCYYLFADSLFFDTAMLASVSKVVKKAGKNVAKIASTQLTTENNNQNPSNNYASVTCGKFAPGSDITTTPVNDANLPIQGDLSGKHFSVIVTGCNQPDCGTTNCADANKVESNPCNEDATFHQGPVSQQFGKGFSHEFAHTATHVVPSYMTAQTVDISKDFNGPHPLGQSTAVEPHTTTLSNSDVANFNEHPKAKKFFQENDHTDTVVSAMPIDSIIK